ncbi:MAG: hypothetical protein ACFFDN_17640 [Candidatus Hodarchaeota archaeon]
MECPECKCELKWIDYYGTNLHLDEFDRPKPGFNKIGDIYQCDNEECNCYQDYFHTDNTDELKEGYPC